MLFTLKTLQQKSFQVEADPSVKVSEFKELIQTSQGFPKEHQKLIFSGKILADDAPMSQYNIAEKDFLVVMVTKSKPAASSATAASTTPVASPSAPSLSPAAPSSSIVPVTSAAAAASTPAAPVAAAFDASTLATGSAYSSAVENLVEMGFPHDQVLLAMRAAFNNPDRAAEYLMTGIPASVREPVAAAPASPAAPGGAASLNMFSGTGAAETASSAAANPAQTAAFLETMRNSPQFAQLRQLIQNEPQLLEPILQQLGQSNPELLQVIAQNPEAFMQMLGAGDMGEFDEEGGEEAGEGGGLPGGSVAITITPQENESIERLVALGFDRNTAIEAFLACDKNEELAANYLFENQFQ